MLSSSPLFLLSSLLMIIIIIGGNGVRNARRWATPIEWESRRRFSSFLSSTFQWLLLLLLLCFALLCLALPSILSRHLVSDGSCVYVLDLGCSCSSSSSLSFFFIRRRRRRSFLFFFFFFSVLCVCERLYWAYVFMLLHRWSHFFQRGAPSLFSFKWNFRPFWQPSALLRWCRVASHRSASSTMSAALVRRSSSSSFIPLQSSAMLHNPSFIE